MENDDYPAESKPPNLFLKDVITSDSGGHGIVVDGASVQFEGFNASVRNGGNGFDLKGPISGDGILYAADNGGDGVRFRHNHDDETRKNLPKPSNSKIGWTRSVDGKFPKR